MAILKSIELQNGITVNYHRVVSVNNITNHASIIEVASYPNKAKRKEEKEKIANHEEMDIFINTEYLETEYNPDLNVIAAYDYLKTTEKFGGAKNA